MNSNFGEQKNSLSVHDDVREVVYLRHLTGDCLLRFDFDEVSCRLLRFVQLERVHQPFDVVELGQLLDSGGDEHFDHDDEHGALAPDDVVGGGFCLQKLVVAVLCHQNVVLKHDLLHVGREEEGCLFALDAQLRLEIA